jgi:hypothetical protein
LANNTISNDETSNVSGNGTGAYQAGISDLGNKDNIVNNKISGIGYNMTLPGSLHPDRLHQQHEAARQQQRLDQTTEIVEGFAASRLRSAPFPP